MHSTCEVFKAAPGTREDESVLLLLLELLGNVTSCTRVPGYVPDWSVALEGWDQGSSVSLTGPGPNSPAAMAQSVLLA